jgi:ABC-2 family transporter protein
VRQRVTAAAGPGYTARLLALMDTPKGGSELSLDFSSFIGALFFLFLIQLPLPIALSQLVYEKEKRLRTMMRMHGLSTAVYIAVTYLYLFLLHVIYIAIMMIAGAAAGLEFFKRNSVGTHRATPEHALSRELCLAACVRVCVCERELQSGAHHT